MTLKPFLNYEFTGGPKYCLRENQLNLPPSTGLNLVKGVEKKLCCVDSALIIVASPIHIL